MFDRDMAMTDQPETRMMNARHSKVSAEWYTPPAYVEAAREVMGSIDLDPASCAEANKVVKAQVFYTAEQDGLIRPWNGRCIFLNPPGGKNTQGSLVKQFWERLLHEPDWLHSDETNTQAIWIGYSLEQLQTLQDHPHTPLNYPMCVPRRRIAFIGAGKSPSHGNYITYIGSNVQAFERVFGQFGQVRI